MEPFATDAAEVGRYGASQDGLEGREAAKKTRSRGGSWTEPRAYLRTLEVKAMSCMVIVANGTERVSGGARVRAHMQDASGPLWWVPRVRREALKVEGLKVEGN